MNRSSSPPAKAVKRVKLESVSPRSREELPELNEDVPDDLSEDHCAICLQEVVDRTMIPVCSHDLFCFDCLMIWTEQSRRCPLCSQNIGDHVIHNYRSRFDYSKHFLSPLRTSSPKPLLPMANRPRRQERRRRIPREVRERSRREREEREEADRFDRALAKRKWIYRHNLYAKHIASNSYTRFRPFPTPAQFSASPDMISRTTSFLRRELLVWMDLDVEFLTTFIISLMKAIDIRSETAVKLLAEFLDMDTPYAEGGRHVNAEHFAHEVYSYIRSPYKDLFVYDTVVQYETPSDASPPRRQTEDRRSRLRSPPPRKERDRRSRSPSRSMSWSPSGRMVSSTLEREREVNQRQGLSVEAPPLYNVPNSKESDGDLSSRPWKQDDAVHSKYKGKRKAGFDDPISFESAPSQKSRLSEREHSPHTSFTEEQGKPDYVERRSSEPVTEVAQATQVPSTSTSAAVASNKPLRTLNLRALVQSHVAMDDKLPAERSAPSLSIKGQGKLPSSLPLMNTRDTIDNGVPPLRIKGQGRPSSSSQLSPPSLLSRLSDTHLGEVNMPVSAASNQHRHLDGDEQPRLDLPSSDRMSSLTALNGRHDVARRLRDHRTVSKEMGDTGPVTKNDSDHGDGRVPSTESLPSQSASKCLDVAAYSTHVEPRVGGQMNGEFLGSDSRPSDNKNSHTSVSTVNTRLLHRLAEEKRHLQENISTPLPTIVSTAPGGLDDVVVTMKDSSMSSSVPVDSQAMETKLRARAQLRMRLASEKKISREKSS